MEIMSADRAKAELEKARPTEVDASTIYKFNKLVQEAITKKSSRLNQDEMRKLELFLNDKQRAHFTAIRKAAGFKYFFEAGDPREPMSYDIEYWHFE